VHQRTPFFLGSPEEVDFVEKTLGAEGSDKPTKEKQAKATASDSSKATDASSPSKRPASEKVGTETLSTWMFRQEQQGHMDADLAVIINSISVACKRISNLVATAPIAGLTGLADSTNESGDEQKKLDIISNDIFCDAMKDTSRCAAIVTEEEDVPLGVADCVSGDCTYCAFPKSQHCFTEAGDCCPYIAIYKTDLFLLQSQTWCASTRLTGRRTSTPRCLPGRSGVFTSLRLTSAS